MSKLVEVIGVVDPMLLGLDTHAPQLASPAWGDHVWNYLGSD